MAKNSIFARLTNIFRSEAHAQLDRMENTENALNQEARNFASALADMESATAQSIGTLRMAEKDYNDGVIEHTELGKKAQAALTKAESERKDGNEEKAGKFEAAARTLLTRQIDMEHNLVERQEFIKGARVAVNQQKANVVASQEKYRKLLSKRDELVTRSRTADAMSKMQDTMVEIDTTNVSGQLGRLEAGIRKKEAKIMGNAELAASSSFNEMASIEALVVDDELERRMAGLKSGDAVKSLTAL